MEFLAPIEDRLDLHLAFFAPASGEFAPPFDRGMGVLPSPTTFRTTHTLFGRAASYSETVIALNCRRVQIEFGYPSASQTKARRYTSLRPQPGSSDAHNARADEF